MSSQRSSKQTGTASIVDGVEPCMRSVALSRCSSSSSNGMRTKIYPSRRDRWRQSGVLRETACGGKRLDIGAGMSIGLARHVLFYIGASAEKQAISNHADVLYKGTLRISSTLWRIPVRKSYRSFSPIIWVLVSLGGFARACMC
jgi:hypothetical protein